MKAKEKQQFRQKCWSKSVIVRIFFKNILPIQTNSEKQEIEEPPSIPCQKNLKLSKPSVAEILYERPLSSSNTCLF